MQDIPSINGGGSRLFNAGGGGGGGDRRLRPQSNQALKCPRCDSLNTKFCYYNNYNLSQPRHFCKSCRRYWTKGGVLRNVPVGGGCRKTKRSNKPKQTTDITTVANTIPPPEQQQSEEEHEQQQQQRRRKSSNSNSSSESSSLTATNTAAAAAANNTALEVVSAHSSSSVSNNLLNGINESKPFNGNSNINSNSRGGLLEQGGSDCGIFSEIGSFTSLITATNDHLGFGFSNLIQPDQNHQWQQPQKISTGVVNEGMKLHESMAGGYIDQTVQIELSELQSSRSGNNGGGGFGTLDWQGTGGDHQGLFDLPNAVDQNYWNQSQWTDQDQPSLYLP